jgi:hypothetical protein
MPRSMRCCQRCRSAGPCWRGAKRAQVPLFLKIRARPRRVAGRRDRDGLEGARHRRRDRDQHDARSRAVKHLIHGAEAGGLSGAPVFDRSNRVIAQLRAALGSAYPIIGVGGVMSGADACAKVAAGADLVQIYTGFIYKGPGLVGEAAQMLSERRS